MTYRTIRVFCVALSLIPAGLGLTPTSVNCAFRQNPPDEASLRTIIERYFAAYASKDLDVVVRLWSDKSPDLEQATTRLKEFFSLNKQIETRNLTFGQLKTTTDHATAPVTLVVSAIDEQTNKPALGWGKQSHTLSFVKEAGEWKIWRDVTAEEELAEELAAAQSDEARQALLIANKELANVELRRALVAQGMALRVKGNYRQALAVFDLARKQAEDIDDKEGVGDAWNQSSYIHFLQSKFDMALEGYQKGLVQCEASGQKKCIARSLQGIGTTQLYKGNVSLALEFYQKELARCQEVPDGKVCVGSALGDIGNAHLQKGEYERAIEYYRNSLVIAEEFGNKGNTATAFERIALAYSRQNKHVEALENYQKSLSLLQALGDKGRIGRLLGGMGSSYGNLGAFELALDNLQRSLAIRKELGDKLGAAVTLENLGWLHLKRSDYASAMIFFEQSLAASEAIPFKNGIAASLNGIGIVHNRQGNFTLALHYYKRALELAETQQQRATIGTMLNNIGYTYSLQGDYAQALDHYQKSLTVAESLEEKSSIAFVLNNLGVNHRLQGSYLEALENLQKSLSLREGLGDKWGMAETLIEMAKTHHLRHDYTRAVESTERAIKLAKEIGDREKIWEALTQSGIAHRALDQLMPARAEFEEAISTIEVLRGSVAGDEQTQQKVFAGKVSPYYEMVGLLIDQGHADEALVYAEYAKARVLLDVLRNGKVNIIRSMTAKEQEQEQVLRQIAFSLNTQISAERLRQKSDALRLAQLQTALQKAHLAQEDFQSRLFAAHPHLQIQRGQIPRFTVRNSGSLLPDSSTALLEYAVVNDKTYLFVLSRATDKAAVEVKVFVVPIKRSELASKVESFRQKLAAHNLLIRESARGAYDLLLKPAQALLRNKSSLIIVPDDVLWELPFQALVTESNHYLIEQSAISYTPSLTVLREMLAKRRGHHLEGESNTSLLALGNPALGQATIERAQTTRDQKLVPLPEAEREVQTLAKLYGASKSEVLIGAEAREDRAKNDAAKFRVLHFATHGIVNNSSPMYSYLVLSQGDSKEDGLLEAWELLNMDLKADLVVLSACETARGRVGAGEGMIGLSWALFVAGTPTTVVSQWKVDSASTTELMLDFHRNLLANSKANSKAQSLRKAMLKLLNTNQYKHPFYWAPFVVIGDAN